MARIKIEITEHFIATCHIPVRITDINYGNHVGNDSFVAILHDARVQWLKQYGYTELDLDGIGLIMSDLVLDFRNEAFYGDVLEINIAAGELTRVSFDLLYRVQTLRNKETIVLAHAKTGMVCYDYSLKKVTGIPESIIKLLTI